MQGSPCKAVLFGASMPPVLRLSNHAQNGGTVPPWFWKTSKILAGGMGNLGIQGTVLGINAAKFGLAHLWPRPAGHAYVGTKIVS